MVDCAALEMLCTARYRGFESLPLRQLDISLRSRARARAGDRARLTGGMRTLGSVRPSAEQAIRQDWGKAPQQRGANPSLSARKLRCKGTGLSGCGYREWLCLG